VMKKLRGCHIFGLSRWVARRHDAGPLMHEGDAQNPRGVRRAGEAAWLKAGMPGASGV